MVKWPLGDGGIPLANLSHIGIAVKSAEETCKFLSSIWQIGDPEAFEYEPQSDDLFLGEQFRARLVFVKFGPVPIELLEPLDDKSIWHKFIQEKGEGIHHIALGVSNYDEQVEKLEAEGHTMLVSAVFEGCRWCYFDTSPGGIVLELREEYARA